MIDELLENYEMRAKVAEKALEEACKHIEEIDRASIKMKVDEMRKLISDNRKRLDRRQLFSMVVEIDKLLKSEVE